MGRVSATSAIDGRRRRLAHDLGLRIAGVAMMLLLAGCVSTSGPRTIMVVEKDMRPVWDDRVIGLRTSPVTNRVVEVRSNQIIRQYWVKDIEGTWYRVGAREWAAARPGQLLDIAR